jgi:WD40 repeat protein
METLLSKISENIENIQASPAHNAVGLRVQNIELANKLKSIKLIKNIPKVIDNGYECDNKFCVIKTFKNENIIAYPNSKYGINAYNLATNEDKIIIKKAHESNIHCMSYCQNEKTQKTLLITCSFDTNMNVYCIEDNWKLVKNFINAHNDYSIFSLDSLYNEENGIIAISGNRNLEEVKIWFCEKSEKNKEIKVNSQVFCIKHNPKNADEIFIGTNEGILQYNISKISDNDNKPEKSFIDNEIEKKSNHLCICFLDNNEYNLIEGDEIGKIRIWALNTGNLINKFERGILKYSINTLEKWDDRFIFGGSRDGKIILFDVIDCVQVNEIGSHNGYVYCVKITDHFQFGKIIVSCGFDGDLKIWGSSE